MTIRSIPWIRVSVEGIAIVGESERPWRRAIAIARAGAGVDRQDPCPIAAVLDIWAGSSVSRDT